MNHGGDADVAKILLEVTFIVKVIPVDHKKVLIDQSLLANSTKCRILNLCEMLNVLNAFFQVLNSIDKYAQFGIEWDLSVHVCLPMHEAGEWICHQIFTFVFFLGL